MAGRGRNGLRSVAALNLSRLQAVLSEVFQMMRSPFVNLPADRVGLIKRTCERVTGRPYPKDDERSIDSIPIEELISHRRAAVAYAGVLLKKIGDEKREITPDESAAWEDLHALADNISEEIEWREANNCPDGSRARRSATFNPDDISEFSDRRNREQARGGAQEFVGGFIDRRARDKRAPIAPFVDGNGRPLLSLTRGDNFADFLPRVPEEFRGATFDGLMKAAFGIEGKYTDADKRALSMASDASGLITVPTFLMGPVLQKLTAKNRCMQAGARTIMVDGATKIARVASGPGSSWLAEAAQGNPESSMTMEGVTVTPYTHRTIIKASRELIADSANIQDAISGATAAAFAVELDKAGLAGTGSGQPTGLRYASGVLAQHQTGTPISSLRYSGLITAIRSLYEANAGEPTAAIMSPRTWAAFEGLTDSTGQPLNRPPSLQRLPFLETTSVVNTDDEGTSPQNLTRIYLGDYREMAFAMRAQLVIEILRERYAETFELGFLAYLRADVVLFQPSAFMVIRGVV